MWNENLKIVLFSKIHGSVCMYKFNFTCSFLYIVKHSLNMILHKCFSVCLYAVSAIDCFIILLLCSHISSLIIPVLRNMITVHIPLSPLFYYIYCYKSNELLGNVFKWFWYKCICAKPFVFVWYDNVK